MDVEIILKFLDSFLVVSIALSVDKYPWIALSRDVFSLSKNIFDLDGGGNTPNIYPHGYAYR